ncbi:MAG: flagellar protein FlaG [Pseudomonadota bacterium]
MVNPVDNATPPATPLSTVVPLRRESAAAADPAADTRQVSATSGSSVPEAAATQQGEASAAAEQRASARELAEATRDVSSFIQTVSRSLQISVDDELGSTVIRVVDGENGDLVRQIPSEEVLEIARYLRQQTEAASADTVLRGVLIDSEG